MRYQADKSKKINHGFTLIEVLVASFIFATVIITAVTIFSVSLNVQASVEGTRTAVQEEKNAMEQFSRDVRMATKGISFCLSRDISNNDCSSTSSENKSDFLLVKTSADETKMYYVKYVSESKSNVFGYDLIGSTTQFYSLFSADRFNISQYSGQNYFSGYPTDASPDISGIKFQPYVTVKFVLDNYQKVKKESEKIKQTLQTTVTMRSYDQVGSWYQYNP